MSSGSEVARYGLVQSHSFALMCLRNLDTDRFLSCSGSDKKATALLKLIYLEMFGYDMSWASFHILEVMSSQKYSQKRVGYLGAVQSFRSDTEVLMLATNLLKKVSLSSRLDPSDYHAE